ncbi:MAG: T9SS type B sorting domain-containing protein [Bacteroidales bacterium]|nr:T9SS type B sorting domain-containing protein [Bacteroidales bacterium]
MKTWGKYIRRIFLTGGFCIVLYAELFGQCVTAVVYSTDITCSKANDGIIIISNEHGGSGVNEYSIDGGKTWQRYNTFTGLGPGIYDVKIRDAATPACLVTLDPARSVSEPDPFQPGEIDSEPVNACFNYNPGRITFTILPEGGRQPYSFQWYLNGNAIDGETGNSIEPEELKSPGQYIYHCKVTEACGLSGITSSKIFTVHEGMDITITGEGRYCQNTSVNLSAEVGGVSGTISYQWQRSSDNSVWQEIEGANSSDYNPTTSEPGEIYYRINIISAGTVCNKDAIILIDPLPDAVVSGTGSACRNDPSPIITIAGTSGTAPYDFTYNINGEGSETISTISGNSSKIDISSERSGTMRFNLTRVSDANGCSHELNRFIDLEIYALPEAIITGITDVNCYGDSTGKVTATVSGGRAPYTFLWDTDPMQETPEVSGLKAGIYNLFIKDANGCRDSVQVSINQPDAGLHLLVSDKEDVNCPGDYSGMATVSVSGGTTPYSYLWDTYPVQSDATATGLGIGPYNVTVTDFNSCSVTGQVTIVPVHDFCLLVPEAFSPNGDGINDVWYIRDISFYPDIVITIYNRWNQMVWRSDRGYPEPWDGRSNDLQLAVDSYHYVIEPGRGAKPVIGCVTVVR